MSKKKKIELRRCPFCGRTPSVVHTVPYWVRCENTKCWAQGPSRKTPQAAARIWNDMTYHCGVHEVFLDRNGDYGPKWEGTLPQGKKS